MEVVGYFIYDFENLKDVYIDKNEESNIHSKANDIIQSYLIVKPDTTIKELLHNLNFCINSSTNYDTLKTLEYLRNIVIEYPELTLLKDCWKTKFHTYT